MSILREHHQQKRIKRQRRKLRGKYSGNCVSCNAKWSKCWYIASVDNQTEWETRLNTPVRPCDDEVCFQCWDGKIRTSPKRKQTKIDANEINPGSNFTSTFDQTNSGQQSPNLILTQPDMEFYDSDLKIDPDADPHGKSLTLSSSSYSKASPRSSERVFAADRASTQTQAKESESKTKPPHIGTQLQLGETESEEDGPSSPHDLDMDDDKDVMQEEHEAVFLLSTAFKTFPSSEVSNECSKFEHN